MVTANRFANAPDSATIGTVYSDEFEFTPLERTGELLEVVPGLIITQHSGEGKANQYFLRGFNLDHGTDFAFTVDDVPVNMRTHAHGQGYADLNFLIPELVDTIRYRKGPYYAEDGDFSAAGAADIRYKDRLPAQTVSVTGGSYGYERGLLAGSWALDHGALLYGLAISNDNGPFANRGGNSGSLVLRYSRDDTLSRSHVTFSAYDARFNSTDQIPARAVNEGLISPFDCIDCTDGGRTYRISLAGDVNRTLGPGVLSASAYVLRYHLNLFSDFTYFLDDPVNGDQFEQYDSRYVYGGRTTYTFRATVLGLATETTAGLQTRFDDIMPVSLYYTRARRRLYTVSNDRVQEFSAAGYTQSRITLLPWFKIEPGVRFDQYHFNVEANLVQNSGAVSSSITSPKLNFIFGPFYRTEVFLNLGKGFHSNDARGITATASYDPRSGSVTPVQPATPLVAARGADLGLRTDLVPNVQAAVSLFVLHLDSELTFDGDTTSSVPNRPSTREGIETSLSWRPLRGLIVDADYAYTHARFRDSAPEGNHIPEAPTSTAGMQVTYIDPRGYDLELKFRYFGPRPLTEDGSVSSRPTRVVNLGGGYRLTPALRLGVQVLNVLNSRDHEIDYYYSSRLPGEPAAGVNDFHFHPLNPIEGRVTLTYQY